MSKSKRAKAQKPVQSAAAAQELWTHVKQQLKVDEALAAWVPTDATRSAFTPQPEPRKAAGRRRT